MLRRIYVLATVAFALCLAARDGSAMAQRTFVASYGNDTNSCSISLPCRSFAAAIAQTIYGGEVIVLDAAGYGPFATTQSVSVIAPRGVYAGIFVPQYQLGINVSGNINVLLEGLTLTGSGGASEGIGAALVGELYLRRVTITKMGQGLTADANITAEELTVTECSQGVAVGHPQADGFVTASIVRSTFVNNGSALAVSDNIVVSIVDSEFKANFWGIQAGAEDIAGSPTSASVTCTRCNFNDHGAVAIQVGRAQNSVATVNLVSSQLTGRKGLAQSALTADPGTVIYVTDSLISQWTQGANSLGGEIISLGDNRVYDNDIPGAGFTSTIAKQ